MPAYNSHALSLYCDVMHLIAHEPGEFPVVFHHADQKACRQLAKQAGWKFTHDGRMLCPRCVRAGVKMPKYRHDS